MLEVHVLAFAEERERDQGDYGHRAQVPPSVWMPKFMTRADAMVGANAPPVMAANRSMTGFAVSEIV